MRLLLLSHVANDPDGGASRIYHLVDQGLRERGHEVRLLHLEDMGLPSHGAARRLALLTVLPHVVERAGRRVADATRFDAVMASSGVAHRLFRRLRDRGPDRPLLINHVHGLSVFDHAAGLQERALGHYPSSLANRLVTGPFQQRWDESGATQGDVTLVQNLRDLDAARSAGATAELVPAAVHPELLALSGEESAVERDPAGIVWFASWEPRKGAAYVPRSFRLLREQVPDARLTLGGTGLTAAQLLPEFDERDHDHVTVLGRITRRQQVEMLRRNSIFLFPSISEGFGLALPEAMAFGLAAVTSNTAFGGDHLRDGVNARVVPVSAEHVARALVELVVDSEGCHRIAEAGRQLAHTFTMSRMVSSYEDAIERALARRHTAQ